MLRRADGTHSADHPCIASAVEATMPLAQTLCQSCQQQLHKTAHHDTLALSEGGAYGTVNDAKANSPGYTPCHNSYNSTRSSKSSTLKLRKALSVLHQSALGTLPTLFDLGIHNRSNRSKTAVTEMGRCHVLQQLILTRAISGTHRSNVPHRT
jgi:hypothetical protein